MTRAVESEATLSEGPAQNTALTRAIHELTVAIPGAAEQPRSSGSRC